MSKLKPSAWRTFDAARSITARELNNVPSENGRRDRCASLYPVPLYGADALAEARRYAFFVGWEMCQTASADDTCADAWAFWSLMEDGRDDVEQSRGFDRTRSEA